jgi:hypothetical protein
VRANEEIACKAATGVAALIHPQSVECFATSFEWIKSVGHKLNQTLPWTA